MNDDNEETIATAIREHGNQLGSNLVYLKAFLRSLQERQQQFLKEQREASDKAQAVARWSAVFSAVAAIAAAIATIILAIDAYRTP
jgi:phage portal protein BeeE